MGEQVKLLVIALATIIVLKFANAQTSAQSSFSSEESDESNISRLRCTAICTGGSHDKCTLCGTVCPLTCDRPQRDFCTKQCAVNVCRCEEGYVRNAKGRCVKDSQCPRQDQICTRRCTGGPHDKCTLCGSACPLTCARPNPGICTLQCLVNVCECERGYVRNAEGQCVRPDRCGASRQPQCTRKCYGGPHDRCTLCGSACPLTCDRPFPGICTQQCIVNVCECETGYVRGPDGQCIRERQCPRNR